MINFHFKNGQTIQVEAGSAVHRETSADGVVDLVCVDLDSNEVARFANEELVGYSMSGITSTNKLVVERLIDGVINNKRLSEITELFLPDFVDHVPSPQRQEGLQGVRETYEALHRAFPKAYFWAEIVLAEGDKVAVLSSCEAPHQGSFYGIPPTQIRVKISSIDIYRLVSGRIAEHWGYGNDLGVAQQIGLYPHLLPDEAELELPGIEEVEGQHA